jgi:hypothetical protein
MKKILVTLLVISSLFASAIFLGCVEKAPEKVPVPKKEQVLPPEQKKKIGPYTLKGSNEETTWEGDKFTGKHWGTPIGELKVSNAFYENWTVIKGTLTPKILPFIHGEYYMKRISVTKDNVTYEGYNKIMGTTSYMVLYVTRNSWNTYGSGKDKGDPKMTTELTITPPISDEDWAEFIGING